MKTYFVVRVDMLYEDVDGVSIVKAFYIKQEAEDFIREQNETFAKSMQEFLSYGESFAQAKGVPWDYSCMSAFPDFNPPPCKESPGILMIAEYDNCGL